MARAQKINPYEMIKSGILDGSFAHGAPLVETQLAEWCGVSRTPVREALSRLEHDGLIEKIDRGFVVKARSPEEIYDIYETRISLEVLAARTAAVRHVRVDEIRMEKALENWEKDGGTTSGTDRARLNQAFHRSIWIASRNKPLIDLLSRLSLHLTRYPATTLTYPNRWESAVKEHRELFDAIKNRDADRAGEVAHQHFTTALNIRLVLFEQEVI